MTRDEALARADTFSDRQWPRRKRSVALTTLAAEVRRLHARVEQLRGLCKTAVGLLGDAELDALIGDMEEPLDAAPSPGPPWSRDDDATFGLLQLVSGTEHLTVDDVHGWTDEQVKAAENWAGSLHYAASDNDVEVPPKPAFIEQHPTPENDNG